MVTKQSLHRAVEGHYDAVDAGMPRPTTGALLQAWDALRWVELAIMAWHAANVGLEPAEQCWPATDP